MMKTRTTRHSSALLLSIFALLSRLLLADPVTIEDPSFEGNALNAGEWAHDLSPE